MNKSNNFFVEDFCAIHKNPSKTLPNIRMWYKNFTTMDSTQSKKTYINISLELESCKFCTLAPHLLSKLLAIIQQSP
jgi:hypothetical protein